MASGSSAGREGLLAEIRASRVEAVPRCKACFSHLPGSLLSQLSPASGTRWVGGISPLPEAGASSHPSPGTLSLNLPYLTPPVLTAGSQRSSCKHLLLAQLSWPISQSLLFLAASSTCFLSCSTLNPGAPSYVDKICEKFCRSGARWTRWGAPVSLSIFMCLHFIYIHVVYLFRKSRWTPLCLRHIFKTHTQTLTLLDQLDRQWMFRKFSLWLPSSKDRNQDSDFLLNRIFPVSRFNFKTESNKTLVE